MKNKKTTVTIGIPAYNESNNIYSLLQSILKQIEDTFYIQKIIVVSDASTDMTDKKVKSVSDKRIKLLRNRRRHGQIYSQNRIFTQANTDIVVLLEADTIILNNEYMKTLLQPILQNKKIGLVQGDIRPLPGKSFLAKIVNKQILTHHKFFVEDTALREWFTSGRGGRAFSRQVYKKLIWPPAVPEDVYALLWCRKKKITTFFQIPAACYYRVPEKFSDFVKERQKIYSGEISLEPYFGKDVLYYTHHKPFFFLIKPTLYFLMRYPIYFMGYCILKIALQKKLVKKNFTDFWPTTQSTKILAS